MFVFCGKWNYHTVLVLYNLRVLYNVKFIGGGIHVIEAFIRSLVVGGGGGGGTEAFL